MIHKAGFIPKNTLWFLNIAMKAIANIDDQSATHVMWGISKMSELFSQAVWVVGSHRSIYRTSWAEIVAEFVFQFGYFPGFINQSMTLKVLVQRFKRASCHASVPIPPTVHQCPEIYTFAEFWFLPCCIPAHFSFLVPSTSLIISSLS